MCFSKRNSSRFKERLPLADSKWSVTKKGECLVFILQINIRWINFQKGLNFKCLSVQVGWTCWLRGIIRRAPSGTRGCPSLLLNLPWPKPLLYMYICMTAFLMDPTHLRSYHRTPSCALCSVPNRNPYRDREAEVRAVYREATIWPMDPVAYSVVAGVEAGVGYYPVVPIWDPSVSKSTIVRKP